MNAILSDTINKPNIVSISWGGPEDGATAQFRNEFDQLLQTAAHLGLTVCVAAGDNGSADFATDDPNWDGKAHVDFPASESLRARLRRHAIYPRRAAPFPKKLFGTMGKMTEQAAE